MNMAFVKVTLRWPKRKIAFSTTKFAFFPVVALILCVYTTNLHDSMTSSAGPVGLLSPQFISWAQGKKLFDLPQSPFRTFMNKQHTKHPGIVLPGAKPQQQLVFFSDFNAKARAGGRRSTFSLLREKSFALRTFPQIRLQ